MLKFYLSEMIEIGTDNGFLEGTYVVRSSINDFAEKLVSKFLSSV
jgi:hypothetical protein